MYTVSTKICRIRKRIYPMTHSVSMKNRHQGPIHKSSVREGVKKCKFFLELLLLNRYQTLQKCCCLQFLNCLCIKIRKRGGEKGKCIKIMVCRCFEIKKNQNGQTRQTKGNRNQSRPNFAGWTKGGGISFAERSKGWCCEQIRRFLLCRIHITDVQ